MSLGQCPNISEGSLESGRQLLLSEKKLLDIFNQNRLSSLGAADLFTQTVSDCVEGHHNGFSLEEMLEGILEVIDVLFENMTEEEKVDLQDMTRSLHDTGRAIVYEYYFSHEIGFPPISEAGIELVELGDDVLAAQEIMERANRMDAFLKDSGISNTQQELAAAWTWNIALKASDQVEILLEVDRFLDFMKSFFEVIRDDHSNYQAVKLRFLHSFSHVLEKHCEALCERLGLDFDEDNSVEKHFDLFFSEFEDL